MKSDARLCATGPSCGNSLSDRSALHHCPLCRANILQWAKRKPSEVMKRRTNLTKYSSRMDNLTVNDRKVQVRTLVTV
jgi:hypothetical protein